MERPSSNQVQPGGDQVQPTIWNLLAQAPGTDLEMLKRIQELDPIENPTTPKNPEWRSCWRFGFHRTLADGQSVGHAEGLSPSEGGKAPGPRRHSHAVISTRKILTLRLHRAPRLVDCVSRSCSTEGHPSARASRRVVGFSSDSLCSIARQRVPLSAVVECETVVASEQRGLRLADTTAYI